MAFKIQNLKDIEPVSAYWSNIPDWANDGKCFDFVPDTNSERIPVTKLESWRDFSELLESEFFNRKGSQYIFRGHRRHDWGMTPTLGRLTSNGIVTDEIANNQLKLFRQAIRGRVTDNTLLVDDEQADELWAIGQHYGLMTPLLDWTYSPYVALFFAFSKEDKTEEVDNPYRAIYVLNKTFIESHELCDDIRVIEPRKD
ncbi:MAG: FRG domain-containing protein, partial [Bacteroidota bacterium]|nr:FRG domain-containing protein [Bacteroidota bacterium]